MALEAHPSENPVDIEAQTTVKRFQAVFVALLIGLFSLPASAACEKQVAAAEKKSGMDLVPAFEKVLACDATVAKNVFPQLMQKSGDVESLTALSMVAIENDVWNPVWEMLGHIPDYDVRDQVATEIGGKCAESEKVVSFLQGAYFGLRDIEFAQWDDALVTCESESFEAWLVQTVENPPAKVYDDKWVKVLEIYVLRKGPDSLETLANGARKAAEVGGPFDATLAQMDAAVAPELGQDISPENQARLEAALVDLATGLPPDQARSVADRLANAGSEDAAAKLLPSIYPDRVRGGGFVYAGVAVEAGECKGAQTAVLHVAEIQESGRRYVISDEATGPLTSGKPKLKKCTSEGDWTVIVSPEPVTSAGLDEYVEGLKAQWEGNGYEVKIVNEKPVVLP